VAETCVGRQGGLCASDSLPTVFPKTLGGWGFLVFGFIGVSGSSRKT
jgi:hypothetical protein